MGVQYSHNSGSIRNRMGDAGRDAHIALARLARSTLALRLSIPYLVVGGIAASYYMPGRITSDIDILIHEADAAQAMHDLTAAGANLHGALTIAGTSWTLDDGIGLDLLTSRAPWIARAFAAPRSWQGIPLIDLPYLAMLKMVSGRRRDEADVTGMLAYATDDALMRVRHLVSAEMPGRVEDLEAYLFIGRAERRTKEADMQ